MNDTRDQHGAVCWGELATKDPKAAAEFYGKIFGWKSDESPMPDDKGTYTCFSTKEGTPVAGALKPCSEDQPNQWFVYMTVENVDETCVAVVSNGGSVLMEAFDVPEAGRIAYLADPQGAAFAVITPDKNSKM